MALTKKQTKSYNGFAIPLQPDTELGLAMLIAEDEEGRSEPVAIASTIREATELARTDWRARINRLERGEDPGLCVDVYKLWARGIDGQFHIAVEILSSGPTT